MSKQLKCINQKELAKLIDNLEFGETIEFSSSDNPNTKLWFFAQKVHIPHYDSKFVIFDIVDGGRATIQPLTDLGSEATDIEITLMYFMNAVDWDYEEGEGMAFFAKNKYGLYEAYIKDEEDN